MGIIAKWIDTLGEKERDAIITHPNPTFGGKKWWDAEEDCGCLVGCVVVARGAERENNVVFESTHSDAEKNVGLWFPTFTRRFGPPRMWRLVKARAAKGHRPPLTEANPELVCVSDPSEGTHQNG